MEFDDDEPSFITITTATARAINGTSNVKQENSDRITVKSLEDSDHNDSAQLLEVEDEEIDFQEIDLREDDSESNGSSSSSTSPRTSYSTIDTSSVDKTTNTKLKEGFLTKQGAIRKSWKRRYFVLLHDSLLYYKQDPNLYPQTKLIGSIPLSNCEVLAAQEETKRKNCFKIQHPSRRTFYIYSDSYESMMDWMQSIYSVIGRLQAGKTKPKIGTPIEEKDSCYPFIYELVLGIRHSVGKECGKSVETMLLLKNFKEKVKYRMRTGGNATSPHSKYDYDFIDICPSVFANLRERFGINPADYLLSMTSEYMLSQLPTPGKSGSYFYYSADSRFIVKTLTAAEFQVCFRMLPDYYLHVFNHRDTLISKLYGLHKVVSKFKSTYVVVMGNILAPYKVIHERYDLKGSTLNRKATPEERRMPDAVLKDLDFERPLFLGGKKKQIFLTQLEKDVSFLQRMNIMDYSLLVGIHYFDRSVSNIRPVPMVWAKSASSEDTDRQETEPMKIPDEVCLSVFTQDEGGFRATTIDDEPYKELYFIGIVDIFQEYTIRKQLELSYKVKKFDVTPDKLSSVDPTQYATRFKKFITSKVGWMEEYLNKSPNQRSVSSERSQSNEDLNTGEDLTSTTANEDVEIPL